MAAGTIEKNEPMNSENGSLQLACDLQETPSNTVWVSIEEQLDRMQLEQLLETHAEPPPNELWEKIQPTRRFPAKRLILAGSLIGLFAVISYRSINLTPDASNGTMAAVSTTANEYRIPEQSDNLSSVKSSFPDEDLMSPAPIYSRTRTTDDHISTPSHEDMNYLWVAAQNGKPIRVPRKWSSLSCCLSGETESTECRTQQNAWHAELASTGLGFQADPILGLMELMDEPDDR